MASNEQPSVITAADAAAELAFFKVGTETPAAPAAEIAINPAVKEPETAPPAAKEDEAMPAYEEPVAGDSEGGAADDTFTLPAWVAAVPDESRQEAEKYARNLYEQTQKLKRQRGEAVEARTTAEKERDEERAAKAELSKAPTPVMAPELVLTHLRTRAEVDAFVAGVPKQIAEKQQTLANCRGVLEAIEKDGQVEAFGRTFTESDVKWITDQAIEISGELRQINEDLASVPARNAWLDKRSPHQKEAEKRYPELFKDGTAMAKARADLLKDGPSLDAHPQAPVIIGDHLTMRMVRAGKYKLVPTDPKAQQPAASNAPATANGRESAAPVPRTEAGATKEAQAALRERAAQGDRKAQEEIELQFYRLPAMAA